MVFKKQNAFTLIELMLVTIIIGVLGTMAVKNLKGQSGKARMAVAKADIETNIAGALDLYELDNGLYPTTDQGLAALIRKPSSAKNWNGPDLKKRRIPKDPRSNPDQFQNPGTKKTDDYDLFSMGKDASPGTEDDISNWDDEDEC